jgi:hypothetical protein
MRTFCQVYLRPSLESEIVDFGNIHAISIEKLLNGAADGVFLALQQGWQKLRRPSDCIGTVLVMSKMTDQELPGWYRVLDVVTERVRWNNYTMQYCRKLVRYRFDRT